MAYNASNSLSPMMFKKVKKSDKGGTRNERWRSKSVENIADTPGYDKLLVAASNPRRSSTPGKAQMQRREQSGPPWKEVSSVKSLQPVVACVLPSLAMDFVASSLLAIGATPLITEDPEDVAKDLDNCKAVVVDVSAPQAIVEAFLANYKGCDQPLILVASECGTNDRKKGLALRVIEESGPSFITGRLVDIFTVSQAVTEKTHSVLDSDENSDEDKGITILTSDGPKVVLSEDKDQQETVCLPPALRRGKFRRNVKSASVSPRSSPPEIHSPSPRTSPTHSPGPVNKGIWRLLKKKERASSDASSPLKRVPTAIPRLNMKGQFRDTQLNDVSLDDALAGGQRLAAHTKAHIHLYETNVVTNGETIVELANSQMGMGNLHSTLPVCGAVVAAVLACVELDEQDDIALKHCVHALALYYVAGEEGGANATGSCEAGLVAPGSLRVKFLDALCCMHETTVHSKALIFAYSEGTKEPIYP